MMDLPYWVTSAEMWGNLPFSGCLSSIVGRTKRLPGVCGSQVLHWMVLMRVTALKYSSCA